MPRRTAKTNGIFGFAARSIGGAVKRSRAVGRAKRAYGKELRLSSKLERQRERRLEAERAVKARREDATARKRDEQARKADEKRRQQDRERAEKRVQKEREQAYRARQREDEKREREEQREREREERERQKADEKERRARETEERRNEHDAEKYLASLNRKHVAASVINPARRKSRRTARRNPPPRRGGIVDTVVEGVKGGAVAWGVGKAVNLLPLPQGQYARPLAKIGIGAAVVVYGERLPFVSRDTAQVAGLILIGMAAIEGFNALVAQSPLAQFPVIGNGQLPAFAAREVGALSGASPYSTEAAGDMLNWGAVGYQFE
jgi:hypothetical protein